MNIGYNKELKKAIGWEIKAGRKEKYVQNKLKHASNAEALWAFGANTKILSTKESCGILIEIMNFEQTIG